MGFISTNTVVEPWGGGTWPAEALPLQLAVDAGTGTVELQFRDAGSAWVTTTTYSADGLYTFDLSNRPALRITATGNAQYELHGYDVVQPTAPVLSVAPQTLTQGGDMRIDLNQFLSGTEVITLGVTSGTIRHLSNRSRILTMPNTPGSYSVDLLATGPGGTDTATLAVTVQAAATPPAIPAPTISAAGGLSDLNLTTGQAMSPVNVATDFTVTGGAATYALAAGSGALPTGLSLSSAGVISGTPTEVASRSIVVEGTVTNASGTATDTTGFTLATAAPGAYSEQAVTVPANSLLDYGTTLTGSASSTAMMFVDFLVPTTTGTAHVINFGTASAYVRINSDYTVSILWGRDKPSQLAGYLQPGMRLKILATCDAGGNIARMVAKINGGTPVTILDGSASALTVATDQQLRLFNNSALTADFDGAAWRAQVWTGLTCPDITSGAVQANFWNADGTLVDPANAHTYGTPDVELDGAALRAGTNAGAGTDFTPTGSITDGLPTIPFAVSLVDVPLERYPYPVDTNRANAQVAVQGYTAWGHNVAMQAQAHNASDDSVVLAWASVGSATNGVIDTTLSIPAADRLCYFQMRDVAQTASAQQTLNWTTALHVLMGGQSNTANAFTPTANEGTSVIALPATCIGIDLMSGATGTWTTTLGDGAKALAYQLNLLSGLPVCVMNSAVGGQSIDNLDANSAHWATAAAAMAANGLAPHADVWQQGESNVTALQTPANWPGYAAQLDGLHAAVAAAGGRTRAEVPLIISPLGMVQPGQQPAAAWMTTKDFQAWYLPTAKMSTANQSDPTSGGSGGLTNAHYVGPWTHALDATVYHAWSLGYEFRCLREAEKLAAVWGYTADPGHIQIASATEIDSTTVELTFTLGAGTAIQAKSVTHNSGTSGWDATLMTGQDAFVLAQGGSTEVASAATVIDAITLRLTHSGTLTPSLVSYQYGDQFRYFIVDEADRALEWFANFPVTSSGPYAEAPATFSANSLLVLPAAGVSASSSDQVLMHVSFDVPAAVEGAYSQIAAFGTGEFIRYNSDTSISVLFGTINDTIAAGTVAANDRVNILIRMDAAATKRQVVYQVNGGTPVVLRDGAAPGAIGVQNELRIGNTPNLGSDFVGDFYRAFILVGPTTLPDITSGTVQADFWNTDGTIPDYASAVAYGTPQVLLDGAANMALGLNIGSGADLTKTGTIT